ncbi:MAG: heavy-metal-associated domain-containing protein, partial [Prevotella sp.]
MKKNLFVFAMLLMSVMAFAKDIKTVVFTTQPQMHCSSCEDKIKSNLRFEKGIKAIETSVEKQTVTVTYDADKTTAENLQKGFEKFGYTASVVTDAASGCCSKKSECTAEKKSCCSKKSECAAEKKSCC